MLGALAVSIDLTRTWIARDPRCKLARIIWHYQKAYYVKMVFLAILFGPLSLASSIASLTKDDE